ncbi:DinB family protein [bacterium]|nr:DinB family protein [bacterium]NCT19965.1 DinB family protein [bacterium]OIO84032.1 MAG: hypothetical protein AUK01_11185 [Anaerolineae bacterium CG2_30_57_67]
MPNNKELLEYRARLLARTRQAAVEFCAVCRAVSDIFAPLEPGGWNTHQIAAHVRDVHEQVYGLRLRRTANENTPTFANFDADEWLKNSYQPAESLAEILSALQYGINELVDWLSTLPIESWNRVSRHEVLGEVALQAWAEYGLAHIEEHLQSITSSHLPRAKTE